MKTALTLAIAISVAGCTTILPQPKGCEPGELADDQAACEAYNKQQASIARGDAFLAAVNAGIASITTTEIMAQARRR